MIALTVNTKIETLVPLFDYLNLGNVDVLVDSEITNNILKEMQSLLDDFLFDPVGFEIIIEDSHLFTLTVDVMDEITSQLQLFDKDILLRAIIPYDIVGSVILVFTK